MTALPEGWVEVRLADVAETQLGRMLSRARETGTHARPYLRNRDVRWGRINTTDLPTMDFSAKDAARYSLRPGDVLVCEGGEVGRAAVWAGAVEDCFYQKALHRVRASEALDPRFFRYLLEHYAQTEAFARFTSGSTIAHLPQEDLRNLPVPLPPRAEQHRVVAAIEEQFSRLDAGVASLTVARAKLERLRAAALDSLLYQRDGAPWSEVALAHVLSHARYGTSTKCSPVGDGLPVLRIPNVQAGAVSFEDMKFAVDASANLDGCMVAQDDILIIRTNGSRSLIGRAASVDVVSQPTAFASYLIQLRVDRQLLRPAYLVAVLAAPQLRARIEQLAATTAGQYNISLSKLRALSIPLPPLVEQDNLLQVLDHQASLVREGELAVKDSLVRSARLRSAILTSAFSGTFVMQDPTDEPAHVLLDRIAAERASSPDEQPAKARQRRGKIIA